MADQRGIEWLGKEHSKRRVQVQFWIGNFCFLTMKSLPVENFPKCLRYGNDRITEENYSVVSD